MSSVLRILTWAAMLCSATAGIAATGPDRVSQGEYLARAGDCFSCHTNPGGVPLAGGRQVETPYGTISAPNITPDPDTGIGRWSDDEFYRVLHEGIGRDGTLIYPVMPFDHYTAVTREDALAIKAYLFSVKPVHAPRPASHLAFPFNIRASLAAWRAVNFKAQTFSPDPALTDAQNRGAYLVEGLGHCGACHTPRNMLSGSKAGAALGGGEITGQGWFAPNISSDVRQGVGAWSEQELVDYLRTGVTPARAIAAGPMAEVVETSLRHLSDEDLHAIASYLKVAPAKALFRADQPPTAAGATAYLDHCAFCHQIDGSGVAGSIPPLAGSGVVGAGGPQDIIRTVLGGMPAHGGLAAMPGLATQLSAAEIADIANYIRSSWGNAAPPTATPGMVGELAKSTSTMLAGTGGCDPVPEPLAETLARFGVPGLLREINGGNMLEQIGAIVAKLPADLPGTPADHVNGLTASYCPIATADLTLSQSQRLGLLQQFAALVYAELSARTQRAGGN